MPVPLAIPILGGAAALATILYVALKSDGSGGFPKAEAEDLAQRVCDKGPRGELVFKPELAASLVTSLASQTYQYELATDRSLVQIAPSPGGRPLILSESALGWAKSLNDTHSILAPLYLAAATPAGTKRFLRAVPAGQETDYAGPSAQTMYAVLAYAGTFRGNLAPPGKPPGGGSVSPTPNAPTTPSGLKTLPAEVQRALDHAAATLDISRNHVALEILHDGAAVTGVLVRNADGLGVVHAPSVILATGGSGRVFSTSTNAVINTGDGMA